MTHPTPSVAPEAPPLPPHGEGLGVGGQPAEGPAGLPDEPPPEPAAAPGTFGQFTAQGVTFHFAHRVLGDFARDLASGLLQPLSAPVDVFVGLHQKPERVDTGSLRVCIQTEQILDQDGRRMWRVPRREDRLAMAEAYDAILDLSPQNRRAYRFLPLGLRRKFRFGPHVFPDRELVASHVDAPPIFVGWPNERRRSILARLRQDRPIVTLPNKLFGPGLARRLARQGAVLNIHFGAGVYTEVPRFLKACQAGKPFLSEPLASPFVEGLHYLPLDAVPTAEMTERLFAAIRTLAAGHRFRDFLEAEIAARKAP